ncbi:MAG: ATP synthase F1 subunit gamma [Gemmatimonadetes bacterium]|nr:ATP synthase F1 subunit gamma [Gemmatimonadota bacterium]
MATLRQLRTRVASITNIQRVTNAMQMVAAAKMRRAQERIVAARPYAQQLDKILHHLTGSIDAGSHPLLSERESVERVAAVVITADRGLCGGFNGNICRRAVVQIEELGELGVDLVTVGRKGRDFFRYRDYEIAEERIGLFRELQFAEAMGIAQELTRRFQSGRVDRVLLIYSEFQSVARQVPVVQQLLPVVAAAGEGEVGEEDYLFEPSPEQLLDVLVPRHVNFQVWRALLESNAGEQAARMQAMDSATKNAGDLIEELTREMNKVRQTAITLELMDIIGGAEAVS